MNKVQKKILEGVGVFDSNRFNFSKFSQSHVFNDKKRQENYKSPSFVCASKNDCLFLAESWFRERGVYLSWGTLGGCILFTFFMYFSLIRPWFSDIEVGPPELILLSFTTFLGFFFSYPLFYAAKSELKKKGLQYVAFNCTSKKIHFVSSADFQPKTCSWGECTFCIAYSAGSIEGYYYELRGYLFNEDGSVRDSFSFDDYHYITSKSEQKLQLMVEDLSARFEYVRRFMEDGADSVEPVTGHLDLKPSLSESAHRFQPRSKASDGKKTHIIYSIVRTIFLIPFSVQVVGHYFFCRYCRLPKWPQSVVDECGEEVFPRR